MAPVRSTENPSKLNSVPSRETGRLGERLAADYLAKKGYKIAELNYRCVFGEIDIIACDRKEIVFVEVKSRRSSNFGDPESSVDMRKQKKLSKIAQAYLGEHGLENREARFDVIAVSFFCNSENIRHIRNAFELAP
ncbi:MAG: YraN family protein [Syntrophales bacterium]|jgi:putative endonuclease|nr:YraN family protein [Syntrophales bacterium]MDY0044564.1 YraN family protein [Syntrophales bacterium]